MKVDQLLREWEERNPATLTRGVRASGSPWILRLSLLTVGRGEMATFDAQADVLGQIDVALAFA